MGIAWFRDLVIIIFGAAGALLFILLLIRSFSVFKRVDSILTSLKVVSGNVEEISTMVRDDVVKPLSQLGCLIKSLQMWIELISALFKKPAKEGHDT